MKKVLFSILVFFLSLTIANAYYEGQTYKLVVLKIDPSSTRIGGAEFAICSDAACKNILSTSTNVYQYNEDSGYMEFNYELAFNKAYYLKETRAPIGYRVRTKEDGSPYVWYFMVNRRSDGYITYESEGCDGKTYYYGSGWESDTHYTYNGSKTGKLFLEIRNEPTANLLVHKTDEQGSIVSGTKYKLTSNNTEEIVETDANGNAIFDMLRAKNYTLQEYEVTPGYVLDKTPFKFYVENIYSNFNLYRSNYIYNTRYATGITYHYGKFSNYNPPSYVPRDNKIYYTITHVNRKAPNYEIKVVKKDDDNKPVPNKEYDLSNDKNCQNVIASGKTNSDGELSFNNLTSSMQYYICEHRDNDEPEAESIEVKLVHEIEDTGSSSVKGTTLYINEEENSSQNNNYDQTLVTINVNEVIVLKPEREDGEPSSPVNERETGEPENPPTNNQSYIILIGIITIISGAVIVYLRKKERIKKYEE